MTFNKFKKHILKLACEYLYSINSELDNITKNDYLFNIDQSEKIIELKLEKKYFEYFINNFKFYQFKEIPKFSINKYLYRNKYINLYNFVKDYGLVRTYKYITDNTYSDAYIVDDAKKLFKYLYNIELDEQVKINNDIYYKIKEIDIKEEIL